MDSIQSVTSLLSKLTMSVNFDGKEFKLINPETHFVDYEYNDDNKITKVFYSSNSSPQSMTEVYYNDKKLLDKLVSTDESGDEVVFRSISYDEKDRPIEEDSQYEIIVRTYDDENGTLNVETKDIDSEQVIIDNYITVDWISDEDYSLLDKTVYSATDGEVPISKLEMVYNKDNRTMKRKEYKKNPAVNELQLIGEILYQIPESGNVSDQDELMELEKSQYLPDESGAFKEYRYVNTFDDEKKHIIKSEFYINGKLDSEIFHTFRTEGDVEIEEITGGSSIYRYVDEDQITHEDSKIIIKDQIDINTFKMTKDDIEVYITVPSDSNKNNIKNRVEIKATNAFLAFEDYQLKDAEFGYNDKVYEYHEKPDSVNCYASVGYLNENEDIKKSDEVYFKKSYDKIDDITLHFIKLILNVIEFIKPLDSILRKGGFDYEKIGGGIGD